MFIQMGKQTQLQQASNAFLSLVNFVKEGKVFTEENLQLACDMLDFLEPTPRHKFDANQVLLKFVPSKNGTPSAFLDEFVILFTSPEQRLIEAALSFIGETIRESNDTLRFQILQSCITSKVYAVVHRLNYQLFQPRLYQTLLKIPASCLSLASCRTQQSLGVVDFEMKEGIRHVVFEQIVLACTPYLSYLSSVWPTIRDDRTVHWLLTTTRKMIHIAPFHIPTTLFVRSTPVFAISMILLDRTQNEHTMLGFAAGIAPMFSDWRKEHPSVCRRGEIIVRWMNEEGFDDINENWRFLNLRGNYSEGLVFRSHIILRETATNVY
ncbi:hypothetical protein BLNAU_14105 [Blattamonas nauphoetae]|uniref:Uncharacterized protein n=1 Tax=Blattamonas nauphoetae TaxID=2049346 RepID=A0ABQ9XHK2_9EUKA|nr:hypothetical protein BLNAU_14105 [Blattamonas nauphoetae]